MSKMPVNRHHQPKSVHHQRPSITRMQPQYHKSECKRIPNYIQTQFLKYPIGNIKDMSYLSLKESHPIERDNDAMSLIDTHEKSLRKNQMLQNYNPYWSKQKKTINSACEVCNNPSEIDHIKFNTFEKASKEYNSIIPGNTYNAPIEDNYKKSGWICNNCFIKQHDNNKRKSFKEDDEELKPKIVVRIVLQWSPYGSSSLPYTEPTYLPQQSGLRGGGSKKPAAILESTIGTNYYAIGLEDGTSVTDFNCITGKFLEEDTKTNQIVNQLKLQTTYEEVDIQTYHVKLPDNLFNKNLTLALTEPGNIGSFGPIISIRESDLHNVTKTFFDETCKMQWLFEDPDVNDFDRIADFDFDGKSESETWLEYIDKIDVSTNPFVFKSIQGHVTNTETGKLLDPDKRIIDDKGTLKTPFRYSLIAGKYPNLPKGKFSVHRMLIEVPTQKFQKFEHCVVCMKPDPTHTMSGCNHVNLCEGDFFILNSMPNRRCPTCSQTPKL